MTANLDQASGLRSIELLIPSARNSRKHSPEQVDQLVASMREFGFTIPILVDEKDNIIAGHGRVMAAARLAEAQEEIRNIDGAMLPVGVVPVLVARGWSQAQKRAYLIADNKLTEQSDWDEDMLRAELEELKLGGFNLDLTGFMGEELHVVLNGWDPDVRNTPEPELAGMAALIKVRCPMPQKDEVLAAVKEAVAGIEGVEID